VTGPDGHPKGHRRIGKTVRYAGMKLTFGRLSYDPAKPADSQLTIDTTVENVTLGSP
jgi:hypothetical protein